MVSTCIDICMAMLAMYITSTEASISHIAHIKQLRKRDVDDVSTTGRNALGLHEVDEVALHHPHAKQVADLLAWHIEVKNARWYVKPRFTCWFDECLFKIYTPTCSMISYGCGEGLLTGW